MNTIKVTAGGAAHGLVEALAGRFTAMSGYAIESTFGAVGAMKAKLKAGEVADVVILTLTAIEELLRDGLVTGPSVKDIGFVLAAMAVRAGDPTPALATSDDLRAAILEAEAIYLPDPEQATSGVHFVAALVKLGIRDAVWDRVKVYPNGGAAMRELANSPTARPIGCTQATEIIATPGVAVAGPLPPGLELATTYTAAVSAGSAHPEAAGRLVDLLSGQAAGPLRQQLGFAAA